MQSNPTMIGLDSLSNMDSYVGSTPGTPSKSSGNHNYYGSLRLLFGKSAFKENDSGHQSKDAQIYHQTSSGYYMITKSGLVFGRDPGADIRFRVIKCASRHASIIVDPSANTVYIRDLGSVTGTFINDVRLPNSSKVLLKSGDIITIAQRRFIFERPDDISITDYRAIPDLRKTPNTNRLLGIETARHHNPYLTALKTPGTAKINKIRATPGSAKPITESASLDLPSGETPVKTLNDTIINSTKRSEKRYKTISVASEPSVNSPQGFLNRLVKSSSKSDCNPASNAEVLLSRPSNAPPFGIGHSIISRKLAALNKINREKNICSKSNVDEETKLAVDESVLDVKPNIMKRKSAKLQYAQLIKKKRAGGDNEDDLTINKEIDVEMDTEIETENDIEIIEDIDINDSNIEIESVMDIVREIDDSHDLSTCQPTLTAENITKSTLSKNEKPPRAIHSPYKDSEKQEFAVETTPKSQSKLDISDDSTQKRSVTFGPQLSPEVFNKNHPPSTPVRKGGQTPIAVSSSRRSILKSLSAIKSDRIKKLTPAGMLDLSPAAAKINMYKNSASSVDRRILFKGNTNLNYSVVDASISPSVIRNNKDESMDGGSNTTKINEVLSRKRSTSIDSGVTQEAKSNLIRAFSSRRKSFGGRSMDVDALIPDRDTFEDLKKYKLDKDSDNSKEEDLIVKLDTCVVVGNNNDGSVVVEDKDEWAIPGMDVATPTAMKKIAEKIVYSSDASDNDMLNDSLSSSSSSPDEEPANIEPPRICGTTPKPLGMTLEVKDLSENPNRHIEFESSNNSESEESVSKTQVESRIITEPENIFDDSNSVAEISNTMDVDLEESIVVAKDSEKGKTYTKKKDSVINSESAESNVNDMTVDYEPTKNTTIEVEVIVNKNDDETMDVDSKDKQEISKDPEIIESMEKSAESTEDSESAESTENSESAESAETAEIIQVDESTETTEVSESMGKSIESAESLKFALDSSIANGGINDMEANDQNNLKHIIDEEKSSNVVADIIVEKEKSMEMDEPAKDAHFEVGETLIKTPLSKVNKKKIAKSVPNKKIPKKPEVIAPILLKLYGRRKSLPFKKAATPLNPLSLNATPEKLGIEDPSIGFVSKEVTSGNNDNVNASSNSNEVNHNTFSNGITADTISEVSNVEKCKSEAPAIKPPNAETAMADDNIVETPSTKAPAIQIPPVQASVIETNSISTPTVELASIDLGLTELLLNISQPRSPHKHHDQNNNKIIPLEKELNMDIEESLISQAAARETLDATPTSLNKTSLINISENKNNEIESSLDSYSERNEDSGSISSSDNSRMENHSPTNSFTGVKLMFQTPKKQFEEEEVTTPKSQGPKVGYNLSALREGLRTPSKHDHDHHKGIYSGDDNGDQSDKELIIEPFTEDNETNVFVEEDKVIEEKKCNDDDDDDDDIVTTTTITTTTTTTVIETEISDDDMEEESNIKIVESNINSESTNDGKLDIKVLSYADEENSNERGEQYDDDEVSLKERLSEDENEISVHKDGDKTISANEFSNEENDEMSEKFKSTVNDEATDSSDVVGENEFTKSSESKDVSDDWIPSEITNTSEMVNTESNHKLQSFNIDESDNSQSIILEDDNPGISTKMFSEVNEIEEISELLQDDGLDSKEESSVEVENSSDVVIDENTIPSTPSRSKKSMIDVNSSKKSVSRKRRRQSDSFLDDKDIDIRRKSMTTPRRKHKNIFTPKKSKFSGILNFKIDAGKYSSPVNDTLDVLYRLQNRNN